MTIQVLPSRLGETTGAVADAPRIVVASNRLPVTAIREGRTVKLKRSSGGLVSGLRHIERNWPVRWYGWSGVASDYVDAEELVIQRGASLVAVPMGEKEIAGFYRDYCNSLLWPTLHGMSENVVCGDDAWSQYQAVNVRFARAMLKDLRPYDRIWIHDYHLLLVPMLLRGAPEAAQLPISFFLHTPFPEPEEFERIPQHRTLLAGVLGSDVIGFHTQEYADNFMEAARRCGYATQDNIVLAGSRRVAITVRPMGIDAESFGRLGSDPEVLDEVRRLRSSHKRILLGVDRLDYTKGIPQRLLAFESLLQQRPELHGQVSLLQIAVPSRTDAAGYSELRTVVEDIVERVNQKYGSSSWTPIEYLYDTVDLNTLVSLYRAADVMLVTPARDGLNLVAKEFVATRTDGDGVLVLSRYAGVAKELTSALFVDPNHVVQMTETLYRAVTMSLGERRSRMKEMLKTVTSNGINAWIGHFLGDAKLNVLAS